jgi:hypothetical protein
VLVVTAQPKFVVTNHEPNLGLSLSYTLTLPINGHSSEFAATSVTITTNSVVHFSADAISETVVRGTALVEFGSPYHRTRSPGAVCNRSLQADSGS